MGPGPWVHKRWNGARAAVRISNHVWVERVPVENVIAPAPSVSAIDSPARLAAASATLPGGERIGLVSVESAGEWSKRVPAMILQIQRYCEKHCCGTGLPLIGPHTPTFYSPPNGQTPADATLQLGYVFASRPIAHRLTVQALNDPDDWGPSDHCRIAIDLDQAQHP